MIQTDDARREQDLTDIEREPGAECGPDEPGGDAGRGQAVNGACRSRRGAAIVSRSSGD